jgi:hypothetical protein
MAAAPNPAPTFAQQISNSGALQLVGVIANFSGIVSSALAIYSFIDGLNQPSNATILNAINQLQQALQSDFTQLGDLIVQQTQVVVDTVNRDAMAGALANSDVASDRIQDFLSNKNQDALQTAVTESIAGVEFFIELNLSTPADLLFFLPGFIKAGTIRLFVIASEPKGTEDPSTVVDNINSMVTLLSGMINSITTTVNAAHTVVTLSHTVQCPTLQKVVEASQPDGAAPTRTVTVIDGYDHEENGQILQFFGTPKDIAPCEEPLGYEKPALAAAEQARTQGVYDELAYIGVPDFEQILQTWSAVVATSPAPVITTLIDLNGTWEVGGVAGPVITVKGNAITIDIPTVVPSPVNALDVAAVPAVAAASVAAAPAISAAGVAAALAISVSKVAPIPRPGPIPIATGVTATGSVIDSGDISVNFPGEGILAGEIELPNSIRWSNNTVWTKA